MNVNRRAVLGTALAATVSGLPVRRARAAGKPLTIGVCSDFSGRLQRHRRQDLGRLRPHQAIEDFGAAAKGYDITRHPGRPSEQGRMSARGWPGSGSTMASTC